MDSKLQRPITAEELDTYNQDGVVWLPEIIDSAWAKLLGEIIADTITNPPRTAADMTNLGLLANEPDKVEGFIAGADWIDDNDYAQATKEAPVGLQGTILVDDRVAAGDGQRGHFFHSGNVWFYDQRMRELALRSAVPEVAATLMGSERAYYYGDQILIKPPLTLERTAWHQDLGYGHYTGSQYAGVRIPCDQESMETGAIGYLKGSHRTRDVFKVNFFIANVTSPADTGTEVPQIDGHEDEFDIVYYTPSPGDLVIHNLATLHGAAGNRSADQTRRAATLRYCGDDVTYLRRQMAPPQGIETKLNDGDRLADDPDVFPVAWPPADRTEPALMPRPSVIQGHPRPGNRN
jgi:hypothetical protein